ncbi:hypothetical protein N0V90_000786 [Kalmusia sp. IMI 367209]|nr:hypothetical protein N0V90_000786 [Kalmusia sp. IMI 367209]
MSKRNSAGDVISNKIAVNFAAKEPQLLASLFGGGAPQATESHDEKPSDQNLHVDFKGGDGEDERFGVGAIVPKEVQDGSFTNRIPSSMEKLLENIVGKKAAKEHLASKHKSNTISKPQKPSKPAPTKEESDEEEGRASAFKSRRQRRAKQVPDKQEENTDDEDEESRSSTLASKKQKTAGTHSVVADEVEAVTSGLEEVDSDGLKLMNVSHPEQPRTSLTRKIKPKGYLDEILDERAKKKKKKKGNTAKAEY